MSRSYKKLRYAVYNSTDLTTDLSRNHYKRVLREVFHNECAYCGWKHDLTIDHVIPRSKGGSEHINNLVLACLDCNLSKSNYDLEAWYIKQPSFELWRYEMILQWINSEFRLGVYHLDAS